MPRFWTSSLLPIRLPRRRWHCRYGLVITTSDTVLDMLRPRIAFGVTAVAIVVLQLAGCATRPIVHVGLYGEYKKEQDKVARTLSGHTVTIVWLSVDPPFGTNTNLIIYGGSKGSKALADSIAYDLYREFGTWVAVRPVQVTNHEYTDNHVGVYLVGADYPEGIADEFQQSIHVVPSNNYMVLDCDGFDGSLLLVSDGVYRVAGVQFNSDNTTEPVSLDGRYSIDDDQLQLEYEGRTISYRRELVQFWESDPIRRIRLMRIPHPKLTEADEFLNCNYIQDLDVVLGE